MSPHYFHSVVDHVSKSVLGSPVLIYIDDCCGHKIDAAAFEVIEELLAAMFKSCKFVIEASDTFGLKIVDVECEINEALDYVEVNLRPARIKNSCRYPSCCQYSD